MTMMGPGKSNDGSTNRNPEGIGFWALVQEDFETHGRDIGAQGFWALFWHRFGNWRMSIKRRPLRIPLTILYRTMTKASEIFGGISIPYTVLVGRRVKLEHFGGMVLVADKIGDDCVIRQNTTFGIARTSDLQSRPTLGDRIDVGAGVVIVGQITIGDDAMIGANAVVVSDVPAGAIVGGVPARVLKMQSSDG